MNGVAWNDHPVVKAGIARTVTNADVRRTIETLAGRSARHGEAQLAWGSGTRRGHKLSSAMTTRPTVIALSATLKDGQ